MIMTYPAESLDRLLHFINFFQRFAVCGQHSQSALHYGAHAYVFGRGMQMQPSLRLALFCILIDDGPFSLDTYT